MQWEIVLLLVIAAPFVFYYLIRHGIGRVREIIMGKRSKNETTLPQ